MSDDILQVKKSKKGVEINNLMAMALEYAINKNKQVFTYSREFIKGCVDELSEICEFQTGKK